MAYFSVTIKAKKSLFRRIPKLNLEKILKNCKLSFGSYNDFYILEEDNTYDDMMTVYNPEKIGRGICLDFKEIGNGELTLACIVPATPTEIDDFFNIIREVKSQYKNMEIYFEDEKVDEDKFFGLTNTILNVSLDYLKKDCSKDSKIVHKLACYVFTSDCESIIPIKGNIFLHRNKFEISDSCINFFIGEAKLIDGIYKYDEFIEYVLDKGVEYFDQDHIIVNMSDEEVLEMVESLQKIDLM